MGEEGKNELNPIVFWVIWGGLFMSLFIYLGVLFVITTNPEGATEADPETISTMRIVFAGISVAMIVGLFVARKTMFFDKLQRADAFDSLQNVHGRYLTVCITSWALSEAVAIYGFVLSMLSFEIFYYLIFLAPAVVLFVVFRPQVAAVGEQYLNNQPAKDAEIAGNATDDAGGGDDESSDTGATW